MTEWLLSFFSIYLLASCYSSKEWPQNWESCTRPLSHNMHLLWDNIHTGWLFPVHKTIDMNLKERQVSKQMCSLVNIAEENISMSKTHWFAEPLSVQGLSLRWNWFEDRQIPRQIHSFLNIAWEKHFHKKKALVSSRFEKSEVQVEPGVVMTTQNLKEASFSFV